MGQKFDVNENVGPGQYSPEKVIGLRPKQGNHDYFTQARRFEHGSYLE